jgi:hypothetical protein
MIDVLREKQRIVIAAVVIIVLIAMNVVFLMQWQTANDERSKAETEKKAAEVNLQVTRAQNDLDELRAEEAELSKGSEFPSTLPIVDLSVFLANAAAQYQSVEIKEVKPPARIGTQSIAGKNYPAYETHVKIVGTLSQVIDYLQYIENSGFTSISIDNLTCTLSAETWQCEFTVIVISQS